MATYEGLEFNITANVEDAIKKLSDLKSAFESFSNNGGKDSAKSINSMKTALNGLQKALKNFNVDDNISKIEEIGEVFRSLNDASDGSENISKMAKNLNSLRNAMSKLKDGAENMKNVSFSGLKSSIEGLRDSISGIDDETLRKFEILGASAYMISKSGSSAIKKTKTATIDPTQESRGTLEELRQKYDLLSQIEDMDRASSLSNLKATFLQTAGAIGTMTNQMARFLGLDFKKMVTSVSNLKKKFDGFLSSIGRIALYRAIRSMIKSVTEGFTQGLQNAYYWAELVGNKFASSMDQIATATQYAQNSIGAMAMPLYNMIAPVIDAIIDKFVDLVNIINQVFSVLSGSGTWTKAVKVARSYGDTLSSTGSAAKNAKKQVDLFLASFDELHLTTKTTSSSSGSGSGSTPDYSGMFETKNVDSGIKSFVDQFKDAISKGDWQSAGTMLGEKVNELVNMVDWNGLGTKLGYGLNGAIQTLYYFIHTIDFNNIGSSLATLFNNAIANIDFSYLGGLLVQKTTVMLDTLIGFLTTLDYATLGKSLTDFIQGAFNEVADFVLKYNWGQVGYDITNGLISFISSGDWVGVADSVGRALAGALAGVPLFIIGSLKAIAETLCTNLTEFIGQAWEESNGNILVFGGNIVTGLLEGIINALSGIVTWIQVNFCDPIVNGVKELFGISSTSSVFQDIGDAIINGLLNGITESVGSVIDTVTEFGGNLMSNFNTTWSNIQETTSNTWNGVTNNLSTAWGNIKTNAGNAFNIVKSKISSAWSGVTGNSNTTWNNMKSTLSSAWNSIKSNAVSKFNSIKDAITSPISKAKDTIKNIVDTIKGFFSNFNISLPSIKLPHFSVKPSGWQIGDLLKGSIPSLSIKWYAQGGFPDDGQLFVAREAGAEMVGSINGHTAVANNDQIVAAVSQGVYSAVVSAMNGGNSNNINLTVTLDGETVYKNVVKHNNQKVVQTGSSPLMV